MSTILKAGHVPRQATASAILHFRDLEREARGILEGAQQEAEEILLQANLEAQRLWEDAQEEGYQTGIANGTRDGKEQGYAEALAHSEKEFAEQQAALVQMMQDALHQISEQRQQLYHQAHSDVLEFAILIAERVTKIVGVLTPEAVRENLKAALQLVIGKTDLRVNVNPQDLASLKRYASSLSDTLHKLPHMTFIESDHVLPGGVEVISAEGVVDATLDQQIEEITIALTGRLRDVPEDV